VIVRHRHGQMMITGLVVAGLLVASAITLWEARHPGDSVVQSSRVDQSSRLERILTEAVAQWLLAIFERDPDALKEASGSESFYEDGMLLMEDETFVFQRRPSPTDITVTLTRILYATDDCIVVEHFGDATPVLGEAYFGREILALWPNEGSWVLGAAGPNAIDACDQEA
jgi:hypothetical protein